MSTALLGALAEVLLVNLVLSGDNAVVIGLASRGLRESARRRAIVFGGGFAVSLRLMLTLPAEYLLGVRWLRAGGGLLLAWIAVKLLIGGENEHDGGEAETIATAIRLIVLADLTMSLDNILAVAAVAERSDHGVLVLLIGLALSIPIVLLGGNLVARFMGRLPILVWIGSAVLGYTAGELVAEDEALKGALGHLAHAGVFVPLLFAAAVIAIGRARTSFRPEPATVLRASKQHDRMAD